MNVYGPAQVSSLVAGTMLLESPKAIGIQEFSGKGTPGAVRGSRFVAKTV